MSRLTIAIMTHGNHRADFCRCLESVLEHSPPNAFDLRLGFNQATESFHYALGRLCSDRSSLLHDQLPGEVERFGWDGPGEMKVHCWQATADFGRRAMAHLLDDVPVSGEYLVWFDDNAAVEPGWWKGLATMTDRQVGYFGRADWIEFTPGQAAEIKAQSWYTGVPFLKRNNRPGSSYMSGFMAVRGECLRQVRLGEIGDAWKGDRLKRCGSAVLLGEVARQLGWTRADHSVHVHVRAESDDFPPEVLVKPRDGIEQTNGEAHIDAEERP
jgi:hypothetical protein